MSQILTIAAQKVAQARKVRTAVVKVTGFRLDPDGNIEDQVLSGVDLQNGKPLEIHLGEAPTDKAAELRTTIPQLQLNPKRKVDIGGYVRVDRLRMLPSGQCEAKFVKTIKRAEDDHLRHFFVMKARVFESKSMTKKIHGENQTIHMSRVELMDDSSPNVVKTGDEFKKTVEDLLYQGAQSTQGLGDNIVFMRDGPFSKTYSFYARNVQNEDKSYRKPTLDEIKQQLSEKDMFTLVADLLDQQAGHAGVELIPGAGHRVLGMTASSKDFNTQAAVFYKGRFNVADPQTGEMVEREACGFRETILGLTRQSTDANALWIVTSVAATQTDVLTLNG